MSAPPRDRMQLGVIAVVVVATIGIMVELATSRHWNGRTQLIAWFAAGLLLVAAALVASDSPTGVRMARVLAVAVTLASLFGVWEHVEGNYDSGPLDFRYATTWSTLPATTRWWKAISGGVGAAPPIVPGALALVAGLLVVATLGGASARASRPSPP